LAPNEQAAFEAFGKAVFADGALPVKTKQIIAVAVAHVTQCPYCISGHKAALPFLIPRGHNRSINIRVPSSSLGAS
jgi:alkylhydroperoxidase family enzyme